jgi:hypothetical protein
LIYLWVRDAVVLIDCQGGDRAEEDDGNSVVDDAFAEEDCVEDGELVGLGRGRGTLMRDMAATVSVAQRTQLTSIISLRSSLLKKSASISEQNRHRETKPMMVPMTPKKLIIPKFSKKRDFLSEYPAEKMMGGSMMVKKI